MSSTAQNNVDREHAAEYLKKLSENKDFHDVLLVAELDGKKISVNRCVMAVSSDYFRALLGRNFKEGELDEVSITGVDGPTLQSIIEFCYSGHIRIDEENVYRILEAATPMGLVRVEALCERFMIDNLRTSNCLELLSTANLLNLNDLRGKSWDFVCAHFEALPASELTEVSLSFILEVLKNDQVHANEDLIFHWLVDWIAADETMRSQYASELLKLIHMDKLTLSVFLDEIVDFTKKFDCVDLVLDGHRRRAKNDGTSTDLYRCIRDNARNMFAVSYDTDLISIQKYNPITDRWTHIRDIDIRIESSDSSCDMTLADNILCVVDANVKEVHAYWLDRIEYKVSRSLDTQRCFFLSFFRKNRIFVLGGSNMNGALVLDTCESLSMCPGPRSFGVGAPFNRNLASMQFRRSNYAGTFLDGKIYVAGGLGDDGTSEYLRSVECYNTKKNEWTRSGDMIHPRANFAMVEWNGMLYAMGSHPIVERYDPMQNTWTEIGSFNGSDKVVRAVNSQNIIYVVMNNGQFGKITVGPVCTFLPLRELPFPKYSKTYLFDN